MSDPSLALQGAQYTALAADADLLALIGDAGSVYDIVSPGAAKPYVQIGESQVLEDDTEDCGDGSEIFTRTHVWTESAGLPECKQIAAQVRRVLKQAFTLTGFTISLVQYVQTQFLRDPDGITHHAVIEHRYLIRHSI